MSVPTRGEVYAKLLESMRMCEEHSAMMAHLYNAEGLRGTELGRAWLRVSENFNRMNKGITMLATRGLN